MSNQEDVSVRPIPANPDAKPVKWLETVKSLRVQAGFLYEQVEKLKKALAQPEPPEVRPEG